MDFFFRDVSSFCKCPTLPVRVFCVDMKIIDTIVLPSGFLALFSSFETLVKANEAGDQEVRQAEKELEELVQSGNTQLHNVQALNA